MFYNIKGREGVILSIKTLSCIAVSYTHLDVYKRQLLEGKAIVGFAKSVRFMLSDIREATHVKKYVLKILLCN